MLFKQAVVGLLDVNCYILGCESTKEGVIIDPGGNAEEIDLIVKESELQIKWILMTHGHFDHTGGLKKLKTLTNCPLCIHRDDLPLLEGGSIHAGFYGFTMDTPPSPDKFLSDNEEIIFGNYKLKVLHTPGHSPGSVCFYIEDKIFVGDLLFSGSIGRTDLPGGDYKKLIDSVKNKIFTLPANTTVYPGHGSKTTVLKEQKNNPFFN